MRRFLRSVFLRPRFFVAGAGVVVLFVASHFVPALVTLARTLLVALLVLSVLDLVLLYRTRGGIQATRETPRRLSNGDDNPLGLTITSRYPIPVRGTVVEELPPPLQIRDASFSVALSPGETQSLRYHVHPTRRGEYDFGAVNVFVRSPLGLAERRYRFEEEAVTVLVYPSFLQMRRYELLALSDRLTEVGVKKIRRVGHTMEFDHIREYVLGDDPRTINWKATARRGDLMVNEYRDERAQPVYGVIDMSRVMKLPFDGMTLLDYSINASLVLLNIALQKQDRAGLVTFAHEIGRVVPAERKPGQIYRLQEALYRLDTDFLEADYARLVAQVRRVLRQRSLLVLFTNFETRSSMHRQLSYLRALARQHVLVVVFFENTELHDLLTTTPEDTESMYVKATAEKFAFEKREIVRELRQHGIYAVLTPPEDLTVNTINQYLTLKARGVV
ncbi:MAG: DUF58 domain-containing protein [Bacteroidetes bacterium]|nr:DUF58 domain-containing protein [Bacteroidota bacterium]